jgi:hypothetical protein
MHMGMRPASALRVMVANLVGGRAGRQAAPRRGSPSSARVGAMPCHRHLAGLPPADTVRPDQFPDCGNRAQRSGLEATRLDASIPQTAEGRVEQPGHRRSGAIHGLRDGAAQTSAEGDRVRMLNQDSAGVHLRRYFVNGQGDLVETGKHFPNHGRASPDDGRVGRVDVDRWAAELVKCARRQDPGSHQADNVAAEIPHEASGHAVVQGADTKYGTVQVGEREWNGRSSDQKPVGSAPQKRLGQAALSQTGTAPRDRKCVG